MRSTSLIPGMLCSIAFYLESFLCDRLYAGVRGQSKNAKVCVLSNDSNSHPRNSRNSPLVSIFLSASDEKSGLEDEGNEGLRLCLVRRVLRREMRCHEPLLGPKLDPEAGDRDRERMMPSMRR